MSSFTQALATELPRGITAYCFNPGMTAARMTGYRSAAPGKVADIVVQLAQGRLKKRSGDDIDVWEYI